MLERYLNKELSQEIEDKLNAPYNKDGGVECPHCNQNDASKYELTGYVINDGAGGLYAEKKCVCGEVTDEGSGLFEFMYKIVNNEILPLEE